jgi:hypothetical protein
MSSRQQTQPLDALWISPGRSAPLSKGPAAQEQPLPRHEPQRGPSGPVGELIIGVGYRSGVVAADAVEEVIDGKWLGKAPCAVLKKAEGDDWPTLWVVLLAIRLGAGRLMALGIELTRAAGAPPERWSRPRTANGGPVAPRRPTIRGSLLIEAPVVSRAKTSTTPLAGDVAAGDDVSVPPRDSHADHPYPD